MSADSVTVLLERVRQGDGDAINALMPVVYGELRRLAHSYLRGAGRDRTLQATALVNEAYIKLVESGQQTIHNRSHFFALAARVMRQIMIDYARAQASQKRGGGAEKLELREEILSLDRDSSQVLAIHEALDRLAAEDPRKAQLIEMRFFGGMTAEEAADATGISAQQVYRELRLAQAWLHKELSA
ncbi:MAG: sigma-70 family RNA polymerase sigma factor [Acidobacteria bacterium]|nr:sigma-70 family RNA polymerase sigma factor [Acidobacteriota bacterium]